jgi:lipopolysaccharide biosynthesis glycosyltransferase
MADTIKVSLCADRNVEIGLHVTLRSLLETSDHHILIYLIQDGYAPPEINRLHQTLSEFRHKYELSVINANDCSFRRYRGLYGNRYCFTKLLVPSLLAEDKVLYLDCDLIVTTDLGELYGTDLGTHVIGASGVMNIQWSVEKSFLSSIGLSPNAKYFNSGVLLIDIKKWNNHDILKRCHEFADRYPLALKAADQTVLNYVFRNEFYELDPLYNYAVYPYSRPIQNQTPGKIYHFVGAPKPWDFMGEIIHRNYPFFYHVLSKTVFRDYRTYCDFSINRARRTIRMSRAYVNCLRRRAALPQMQSPPVERGF